MKLLIATGNKGKAVELERILKDLGIQVVLPEELGLFPEVEEIGTTFAENALAKATALYELSGVPTLADDSGLCIDALDGRPGIYTARYAGKATPYPEKFKLLFEELEHVKQDDRTAHFHCAIALVTHDNVVIQSEGRCSGWIGFQPVGKDGFGYDPIFYIGDRSFAQLSKKEKDALSHRGKALRELKSKLEQHINLKGAL